MRITKLTTQSTFLLLMLTGTNINILASNRTNSCGAAQDIEWVNRNKSFLSLFSIEIRTVEGLTDATQFLEKLKSSYDTSDKFYIKGTPSSENAPYTYRLCVAREDLSLRRIIGGLFIVGVVLGLAYLGAKVLYGFPSYPSDVKLLLSLAPVALCASMALWLKRRNASLTRNQAQDKKIKSFTAFQGEVLQQLSVSPPVNFVINKAH
jgi:hypothetical protein